VDSAYIFQKPDTKKVKCRAVARLGRY